MSDHETFIIEEQGGDRFRAACSCDWMDDRAYSYANAAHKAAARHKEEA